MKEQLKKRSKAAYFITNVVAPNVAWVAYCVVKFWDDYISKDHLILVVFAILIGAMVYAGIESLLTAEDDDDEWDYEVT